MGNDVKKDAKRDAELLLRITANIGVPVEPVGIAERLGVSVLEADLRQESFGGLLMAPGIDPEIVLNQGDSMIRRRLTCAYELGHYVLRSAGTNEYARVDLRKQDSSLEEAADEVYAREFAACLLMPEDLVETLAELEMDDLEMALWLVVSREAIRLRLDDLGVRIVNPRVA